MASSVPDARSHRVIVFDDADARVDPSEEKLKAEFGQVNRTYVPIQSVIRIDEVKKEGTNKILDANVASGGNVSSFPAPPYNPKPDRS